MEKNAIEIRLEKLRSRMSAQKIDALFLLDPANVRYLSDFTGEDSYLLISSKSCGEKNYFITDSRYTEQAAEQCKSYEVLTHRGDLPPLPEAVVMLCKEMGAQTLGFEKMHIPYHLYESLQNTCASSLSFVSADSLLQELRVVKDEWEISLLRQACRYTDQVFSAVCEFIQAGKTEKEIEWQLFCLFHEMGCSSSFPPIVVSGPRGAMPHGQATDKPLQNGEFLTMDFGCMYQGYHADITRTVYIGTPDQRAKEIYRIVLEANLRAEAAVKAGIRGDELDAVAREYITTQGYGKNFGHSLGHGVGLDIHEQPFVSARSQMLLPANSLITIEPGIYIPGWGGIRIEDTILVKEEGMENLFLSSKELLCL